MEDYHFDLFFFQENINLIEIVGEKSLYLQQSQFIAVIFVIEVISTFLALILGFKTIMA